MGSHSTQFNDHQQVKKEAVQRKERRIEAIWNCNTVVKSPCSDG